MHCPFLFWLLHVNNCGGCHHLSLVRNGVKGTEEGQQVWVPAVFQMVYLIYFDHTLYFLYPKKAFDVMLTIILLLHVQICGRGHHLSPVTNGVKVT
jgi:hypothetical protein